MTRIAPRTPAPVNTGARGANPYQPPVRRQVSLAVTRPDDLEAAMTFASRAAALMFGAVASLIVCAVATNQPEFLTNAGKGSEMGPLNTLLFFGSIGFFAVMGTYQFGTKIPVAARLPTLALLGALSITFPIAALLLG